MTTEELLWALRALYMPCDQGWLAKLKCNMSYDWCTKINSDNERDKSF